MKLYQATTRMVKRTEVQLQSNRDILRFNSGSITVIVRMYNDVCIGQLFAGLYRYLSSYQISKQTAKYPDTNEQI